MQVARYSLGKVCKGWENWLFSTYKEKEGTVVLPSKEDVLGNVMGLNFNQFHRFTYKIFQEAQ